MERTYKKIDRETFFTVMAVFINSMNITTEEKNEFRRVGDNIARDLKKIDDFKNVLKILLKD